MDPIVLVIIGVFCGGFASGLVVAELHRDETVGERAAREREEQPDVEPLPEVARGPRIWLGPKERHSSRWN